MIVGLVGLLLSLFWWERCRPGYWGWHRGPARTARAGGLRAPAHGRRGGRDRPARARVLRPPPP
jgi:hypothetical protein